MRAITVRQPWASLIAEGMKSIETRPKRSPWSSAIGETIAIHAAVKVPRDPTVLGAYRVRGYGRFGRALVGPGLPEFRSTPRLEGYTLPLGAVVATCTLVDVVPMVATDDAIRTAAWKFLALGPGDSLAVYDEGEVRSVSDQRPFGDFAPGRWALLLDNVVKCVPAPCRGYQGLWTVPPEVSENLMGLAA